LDANGTLRDRGSEDCDRRDDQRTVYARGLVYLMHLEGQFCRSIDYQVTADVHRPPRPPITGPVGLAAETLREAVFRHSAMGTRCVPPEPTKEEAHASSKQAATFRDDEPRRRAGWAHTEAGSSDAEDGRYRRRNVGIARRITRPPSLAEQ